MADLSDVETAFVTLLTDAFWPNGISNPSVIAPTGLQVFAGWPMPRAIDANMAASPPICAVSVYPMAGDRDVTRFQRTWDQLAPVVAPTLSASVAGLAVTLSGATTVDNYVSVHAGNQTVSAAVGAGSTLSTLAAALAAQFVSPVVCSASGPTITFTAGVSVIAARVAAPQPVVQEIERIQKRFCLTVWAPNDAIRNQIAKVIRPAVMTTAALPLPDGTTARCWPVSDTPSDDHESVNVYRRDLCYLVEFPTLIDSAQYPVTAPSVAEVAEMPDGSTPEPVANFNF